MRIGQQVPVLINRAAVGATRVRQALRAADAAGAVDVRECEPADLGRQVGSATAAGARVVAVAGGDGTHTTAARELVGTQTALLPFPAGTLNHFAERSGVGSIEAAIALLRGGRIASRPVGILDDLVFLNTAIIGAYPAVVRRRDRLRRFMPKWPAALAAFAAAGLRAPRRMRVALELSEGRVERVTTMVWIGVGRGSYPLPQQAGHPGSTLEVAVLRDVHRLRIASFLVGLVRHATRPNGERPTGVVELFHAQRLLLRADRAIDVTLDGEPRRFSSPVFVAIQDDALTMVVGGDSR